VEKYLGTRETDVVSNPTKLVICSLKILGWGHGLAWADSGLGQVAGTCECTNEPSGSI